MDEVWKGWQSKNISIIRSNGEGLDVSSDYNNQLLSQHISTKSTNIYYTTTNARAKSKKQSGVGESNSFIPLFELLGQTAMGGVAVNHH